jgi:hypothetical protein
MLEIKCKFLPGDEAYAFGNTRLFESTVKMVNTETFKEGEEVVTKITIQLEGVNKRYAPENVYDNYEQAAIDFAKQMLIKKPKKQKSKKEA